MTSLEILEMAAMIENKTSDIYGMLHEKLAYDAEVAKLFEALALEEEGHAGFLEAKIKMLKIRPDAFGTANVDGSLLEDTFREMERLEAHIRDDEISVEEAIRIALRIERHMVEEKYNDLIKIAEPSLQKIFRSLTEKDDHLRRIESAAEKKGILVSSLKGGTEWAKKNART